MKTLTCYIVDDEPQALALLQDYIEQTPGLQLVGQHNDSVAALQVLTSQAAPDLLFLDVDMPALSGMRLADMLKGLTHIVFTTAYPEYAVSAFELAASDYLLKPVFYDRFLLSIQRIRQSLSEPHLATSASLYLKNGRRGALERININDIRYAMAALNYIEIYLDGRRLVTYLTLDELLAKLPADAFSRIHKSYLVAHDQVRTIEASRLRLLDDTVLPLGRSYRAAFRTKLSPALLFSKRDLT